MGRVTHGTHRDYEGLIREAGEWGLWQWRMVAVMLVPAMTASAATLSWVFTARPGVPECDGDPGLSSGHGSLLGDLGLVCRGHWVVSLLARSTGPLTHMVSWPRQMVK